MRNSLLAGGLVAVAAAVAVWIGAFLGLELDSFALIGVAMGAVVALVPDGRPGFRLAGFAGGIVVTLIGYVIRAAMLPDAASGRAISAFIILALCTLIAGASMGRIPLWSTLVGAGTMFGAYEAIYAAAPPEIASTSMSTLTSVLLTSGIGFLVGSLVAPSNDDRVARAGAHQRNETDDDAFFTDRDEADDNLDNEMERAK